MKTSFRSLFLFLALAVISLTALAQTPATLSTDTDFTNFYSLSISAPQVDALVAYLGTYGVPAPTRQDNVYTYPGGSYHYESLTFALPDGTTQVSSLALAVAAPNTVLNELASKGLIKLANPLASNAPVPGVNVPMPAPTPPAVPTAACASPVGPAILSGPSTIGSRYFIVPCDQSPAGTIWTASDGTKYQKQLQATPFGNSAWWERIA